MSAAVTGFYSVFLRASQKVYIMAKGGEGRAGEGPKFLEKLVAISRRLAAYGRNAAAAAAVCDTTNP